VRILSLMLILLTIGIGASAQEGTRSRAPFLRFHSEIVRLSVVEDSVEIEGIYRMLCRPSARQELAALFYPYPRDSLLGGARSLLLEARVPGGAWEALDFRDTAQLSGARWTIPLTWGDTLDVRTVYRQALHANYARYIVTTTQVWGRPLVHARFEITLPEGAEPEEFSFPFRKQEEDERTYYLFEADEFLPDHDITVTWKP